MLSFSSALKQSQTHTLFSSLQKLNQILVLNMLTSSFRSALFLGSNVALVLLLKRPIAVSAVSVLNIWEKKVS